MTDARASRVAAEALTALAPPRRVSRLHGEALLGQAPPSQASGVRIEVLHAALAAGSTAGTLAASLPRLGARITATAGPPSRRGTLSVVLPRLHAAATGRQIGPTAGLLSVPLPKMRATVTGTQTPPGRSGALAASLPKLRSSVTVLVLNPDHASLTATLPRVRVQAAGYAEGPAAHLPALQADFEGVVPLVNASDLTFGNDGYSYGGNAEVDYEPTVADAPPHLARQPVRRIHVSLPTPTLVKGRPQ